MVDGDVPVTGSAVKGGTFTIKATKPRRGPNPNDPKDLNLNVRTQSPLRIFVNNGSGKTFNEPLNEDFWRLDIFEDTPAEAAKHPATKC